MTMPPVEEREIRRGLTPAEKFAREMNQFGAMCVRIVVMSLILTPLLITSILTIDIPARFLNGLFLLLPGLRPVQWLTWGGVVMALVSLVAILFARKHGGQETSRAIILSWFIVAIFILLELSVLASVIEAGDFPSARFISALVASAMSGQLVSVAFYDVARGGGHWWRAPFFAAITGFFVTAVIYFPAAYWSASVPWGLWMVGDMMVKTIFAVLFLPIYAMMRKSLRPRGGYGG